MTRSTQRDLANIDFVAGISMSKSPIYARVYNIKSSLAPKTRQNQ